MASRIEILLDAVSLQAKPESGPNLLLRKELPLVMVIRFAGRRGRGECSGF